MSKTNKELAIDVAIAAITSNPKMVKGPNNLVSNGLDLKSICNIITAVNSTLEKIDKNE